MCFFNGFPLEKQVQEKRAEIDSLRTQAQIETDKFQQERQEYTTLKASIEHLYSTRVAPGNHVYEIRATAKATGKQIDHGPEYKFTIFLNTSAGALKEIKEVHYSTLALCVDWNMRFPDTAERIGIFDA